VCKTFTFYLQIAKFADWLKCTQKNAGEKSHDGVETICSDPPLEFEPECGHTLLFPDNQKPKGCN